ncbi:DNA adenine methylase [Thalassospira xiamenensis]|uniref:site-specific DNA-methyltransferase (adenine-specific) n=1 Tax=Thalassospira xiamenensis TaxID=220697 RepID=A0A285TTU6_9PROT|nr:DNA adenine methylase [Thalassospira xiamenensis]SOC26743.1 DNA adenine methylase [Thalassospira xiamenensis]
MARKKTQKKAFAPPARPLFKWTGGKTDELPLIEACKPHSFHRLIEPFVGGGAVLLGTPVDKPAVVNDLSQDLIALYRYMAEENASFIDTIMQIDCLWNIPRTADMSQSDGAILAQMCRLLHGKTGSLGNERDACKFLKQGLARKRAFADRMKAANDEEAADIDQLLLTGIWSGLYTWMRHNFNQSSPGPIRSALFWFMRDFCYGGMFRTNGKGEFNVPYGGASYSGRSIKDKLDYQRSPVVLKRLKATAFYNLDFEAFLEEAKPTSDDFVFLDPPYDSPFSTYDGNRFTQDDHRRLAQWMRDTPAKWLMVISETNAVNEIYGNISGTKISRISKVYRGNIKGRVNNATTHLMISNYPHPSELDLK